jgi:phospholipid/cholesterol/gamma-HCH transport system ATP-binding protein
MVSVRGLSHAFGAKQVLRDVDLEVEKGQIVAIMGSSGGGKTTLLKCISGLLVPQEGEIEVAGVDVVADPEAARRKMGMVFQSAALFDYLNVEDNVLFGVRRWGGLVQEEEQELLKTMLKTVGLEGTEQLMPNELSGGMRKRVGIARALAMRPDVMLYDEPTTGLDPVTVYTIDQLIVDVRDEFGITSLVVSHDVSSVFRTADRIAFLDKGDVIFFGGIEDFQASREKAILELVKKSEARVFEEILRETH